MLDIASSDEFIDVMVNPYMCLCMHITLINLILFVHCVQPEIHIAGSCWLYPDIDIIQISYSYVAT